MASPKHLQNGKGKYKKYRDEGRREKNKLRKKNKLDKKRNKRSCND